MLDAANVLKYLSDNKERLKKDYHLTTIGLFGSLARGDQNENSDIDLAIEFEPNTSDLFYLKNKLKQEFQVKFNRKVDVCRIKYIKPIFRSQIQSEIKYV